MIAGRDFSLFKPDCPKMAALAIWNLFVRRFPQDLGLFERSPAITTLGLKTETLPFEDPYASYALVRFCLLLVVYGWLFVYASCTFLA